MPTSSHHLLDFVDDIEMSFTSEPRKHKFRKVHRDVYHVDMGLLDRHTRQYLRTMTEEKFPELQEFGYAVALDE